MHTTEKMQLTSQLVAFWVSGKRKKINRNDPLLNIFICSSINKTLNPAHNFACSPSVHNGSFAFFF